MAQIKNLSYVKTKNSNLESQVKSSQVKSSQVKKKTYIGQKVFELEQLDTSRNNAI